MSARTLEIRGNLKSAYPDVFTPEAVAALEALAGLDADRKASDGGSHRTTRRASSQQSSGLLSWTRKPPSLEQRSQSRKRATALLSEVRFRKTSGVNGSKALAPQQSRMLL